LVGGEGQVGLDVIPAETVEVDRRIALVVHLDYGVVAAQGLSHLVTGLRTAITVFPGRCRVLLFFLPAFKRLEELGRRKFGREFDGSWVRLGDRGIVNVIVEIIAAHKLLVKPIWFGIGGRAVARRHGGLALTHIILLRKTDKIRKINRIN
jgi:hypothetical protein